MSHRFILLPYKGPSSRTTCPGCGKKREFARYLDTETNKLLPDHVGRCNRELHCGYHFTPKQYFTDNKDVLQDFDTPKQSRKQIEETTFIEPEMIEKSFRDFERNNFFQYLKNIFREPIALDLARIYLIGTSKQWPGANIFWQIDADFRVHAGKIMLYDSSTGKRVRNPHDHTTWVHSVLKLRDFKLSQCFFGEHLLAQCPQLEVCIVESEKTAVICSVYFPGKIWLATGGKYGCRWSEQNVYSVLKGREVVFYPDQDAFDTWNEKIKSIRKWGKCDVRISDFIEKKATSNEMRGIDLADILVRTCGETGLALLEPGYPAIFDFRSKSGADEFALVQQAKSALV